MELSLLLMQEIIKLFAIMVMGFVIVKSGLMKSSDSKSLSVIMAYLINPCVILNAFQVDATPEVQKGLLLACIAATAVHILFLVVTAILKKTIESGCGGTGNADLSQCRNSCYSAGRETAWTGVCDLFQCFYCHTVDSALDTL